MKVKAVSRLQGFNSGFKIGFDDFFHFLRERKDKKRKRSNKFWKKGLNRAPTPLHTHKIGSPEGTEKKQRKRKHRKKHRTKQRKRNDNCYSSILFPNLSLLSGSLALHISVAIMNSWRKFFENLKICCNSPWNQCFRLRLCRKYGTAGRRMSRPQILQESPRNYQINVISEHLRTQPELKIIHINTSIQR